MTPDPRFDFKINVWPQNKCRSLWPIFHGSVILPCILKTIWCMNIIIRDYESVWPDVDLKNICHCDLHFMVHWFCVISWWLFDIWTSYSVWPDIWPQNKCMSLWPIFHGPAILPYVSKTIDGWVSYFQIMRQGDPNFDLKINIGQHDLYFMV